jgi:hypothetical protein
VPGETAAPGSASGKNGTPTVSDLPVTAFNVTVNAVDANWNVVNTNDTVSITSSDANASLPSNSALVSGSKDSKYHFKDRRKCDDHGCGYYALRNSEQHQPFDSGHRRCVHQVANPGAGRDGSARERRWKDRDSDSTHGW